MEVPNLRTDDVLMAETFPTLIVNMNIFSEENFN